MKQTPVLLAVFLFISGTIATFGIANANPSPALPQLTDTVTPTATETPTATLTATPTNNPCVGRPDKSPLVRPADRSTLNGTFITLRWQAVACATGYRVIVRRGSLNGAISFAKNTRQRTRAVTSPLARGYTYFWYVRACNLKQCARSDTWRFTLPAPPTPTPAPATATPQPGDTPVPQQPPPQIAVYKGPGVYLNNDPNLLYYFDCRTNDYEQFYQPTTMYSIALWFNPNESVTYERTAFNIGVVERRTLVANSSGYLPLSMDTASWTPNRHYHLDFTGLTSGARYCGHFDLNSRSPSSAPAAPPLPQTAAAWRDFYARLKDNGQ